MDQPASAAEREARDYLSSLLNKYLRVTSTDGRIFWGQFKCIDPVRCPSPPNYECLLARGNPVLMCAGPQHRTRADLRVPPSLAAEAARGRADGRRRRGRGDYVDDVAVPRARGCAGPPRREDRA